MTEQMTQFKTEGQPAFPVENKENDNSATSSVGEQTNAEQTQSVEGEQTQTVNQDAGEVKPDNFADHPRWKERENDWTKRFNEQEQRHVDELAKFRAEMDQRFSAAKPAEVVPPAANMPEEIPAWFGGDEDAWKEFSAYNSKLVAKAAEEAQAKAVSAIEQKTQAEQKRIEDATNFLNQEVTALESDRAVNPTGEKIDRNKLMKTALDFKLVDTEGRWNYRAAYAIMKNQFTAKQNNGIQERKEIASATTSENRAEPKPSSFTTSEDFQKPGARPW